MLFDQDQGALGKKCENIFHFLLVEQHETSQEDLIFQLSLDRYDYTVNMTIQIFAHIYFLMEKVLYLKTLINNNNYKIILIVHAF